MTDYIAVDERLKYVMDATVVRGVLEGSDHYVVVVKITLRDKWEFGRKNGNERRRKVVAKERQGEEEVGGEYGRNLSERLREARKTAGEKISVNDVYHVFKGIVMNWQLKWLGLERVGVEKRGMHGEQMKLRMQ